MTLLGTGHFEALPFCNGSHFQNTTGLNKFGRNTDIDAANAADIWDKGIAGGTLNWVGPTAARVHAIESTSAQDTMTTGTGAWTVMVIGLDANGLLQSETVEMDGLTPGVNTANSYTMIHRMYVVTAGSGGTNAGDITATAATDGTVTAQITTGNAQTLMAIYQVPSNYALYLTGYYASMQKSVVTGATDIFLMTTASLATPVWRTRHVLGLAGTGGSLTQHKFTPYLRFAGGTTVKVRGAVSADNTDVTAGFDGYLVEE